jgi:hypothetical protein
MQICANLPPAGRDFRLDLFRGLANWAIFLDHIPHEVLNWITIKTMSSATPPTCLCSYPATRPRSYSEG